MMAYAPSDPSAYRTPIDAVRDPMDMRVAVMSVGIPIVLADP